MRLRVDNLNTQILQGIHFTLSKGQNLSIIGANGAGKTTLAKAIASLISNENVSIQDKVVAKMDAKDRAQHINYVPTVLQVYDEYITAGEYLELSFLGKVVKEDIDAVMQLLQIRHLKDKSTKVLSSGESNLLQFASSLIHKAHFTIYDEPTANLDSDKKILIYKILKNSNDLASKIVITHDLNLAYRLGYDILYLKEGGILFEGSCENFFEAANLAKIYGNSIKRIEDYFMVDFS
ncbi:MAG: ABC transporter ATP-binding protein [Campylobacterota bacterium]